MAYSIGAAAKLIGIPPSTIRYYDAEGLLPSLERNAGGLRVFQHTDIESLRMIECLKKSGMPIKDICQFMKWCSEGDGSLQERLHMFNERKAAVLQQIDDLQRTLDVIEYKCWYYQTATDAGTEQVLRNMPLDLMPPNIAELKQKYFPAHSAEEQGGAA
jgi:DNA-binding transcriptional MerR regulator